MVQPVRMQPAQPAAISCLERRIDGSTRWEDRARRRPQCQESAPLQPHWSAADTIPAGSYAKLNQNGVGTDGPGRKPLRMRRESCVVFFFNDTATTEIYTLSLHDALPI